MNWVLTALKSSVGRKLIMACTGLLLCGFLVVHLAGNVLMYVGPDAYNTYAHTLHSQEWFVRTAEIGLLLLFVIHIWLAIAGTLENKAARPQPYRMRQSKIPGRKIPNQISPENRMLFSGVIVLAFLLIHLGDFALNFTMPEKVAGLEPFDKAMVVLRTPFSFVAYLIGVTLLGWHLSHGVTSMFQTLGLRHPKYDPITQNIGPVFAIVIALGFASFPIYAALSPYEPAKPTPKGEQGEQQRDARLSPLTSGLLSRYESPEVSVFDSRS